MWDWTVVIAAVTIGPTAPPRTAPTTVSAILVSKTPEQRQRPRLLEAGRCRSLLRVAARSASASGSQPLRDAHYGTHQATRAQCQDRYQRSNGAGIDPPVQSSLSH